MDCNLKYCLLVSLILTCEVCIVFCQPENQGAELPFLFVLCDRGFSTDVTDEDKISSCIPNSRHILQTLIGTSENQTELVNLNEHFDVKIDKPCAETWSAGDVLKLNKDGSVYVADSSIDDPLGANMFYLEPTWDDTTLQMKYTVSACPEDLEPAEYYVTEYLSTVSTIFLIFTLLIYVWWPELRNVHGKSIMGYLISMIQGQMIHVYTNFFVYEITPTCVFLAYYKIFWIFSAFFWLNVISFDVWSALRGFVQFDQKNHNIKFLKLCSYAWGVPLLLVFAIYGIDMVTLIPEDYRPQFGVKRCIYAVDHFIEFVYYYMIILLVLVANSIFFSLTALQIHRVQREMAKVSRLDSQAQKSHFEQRDTFVTFLRLLLIMGVTWIAEIVSWILPAIQNWIDWFSGLQGVITFVIIVFKPNVRRLIVKSWKSLRYTRKYSTNETNASYSAELR